jgi:hypothetical protein
MICNNGKQMGNYAGKKCSTHINKHTKCVPITKWLSGEKTDYTVFIRYPKEITYIN